MNKAALLFAPLVLISSMSIARAADLADIGFSPHAGAALPLDLTLTDDRSRTGTLGGYIDGQPTLFVFVWYRCEKLCSTTLNVLANTARMMRPADTPNLIAFGIDAHETPADARKVKQKLVGRFPRLDLENRWHFLTGSTGAVRLLTERMGYHFQYDPRQKQFIHPAGLIVLTPEGRVSSYLFGIDFQPEQIKTRLRQATAGSVNKPPANPLLLLCYRYDSATGRYTFAIMKTLRLLALISVFILSAAMFRWHRQERKK